MTEVTLDVVDRDLKPSRYGVPEVVRLRVPTACPVRGCAGVIDQIKRIAVTDWLISERRSGPGYEISQWRSTCAHRRLHRDILRHAAMLGTPARRAA